MKKMKEAMKRIRKIVILFMLTLGAVALLSTVAWAEANDDAVEVESWNYEAGDHGGYRITGDGTNKTLTLIKNIAAKRSIKSNDLKTLDLNGYGIRMTEGRALVVAEELDIIDSTPSRVHYITVDDNGRGISVKNTGTEGEKCFKIEGGYLTGSALNKTDDYYSYSDIAAVTLDQNHGVKVTLKGGTIIGNANPEGNYGGGVCVKKGVFSMEGGSICHNSAKYGGGVNVEGANASFVMSGGSIFENKAEYGGGLFIRNKGKAVLKSGSIARNRAECNGGGVDFYTYMSSSGNSKLEIEGGTITGNVAGRNGGGIALNTDSEADICGGQITGNKAGNTGGYSYHGGGIHTQDNSVLKLSGNPVIKDNLNQNLAENVYLVGENVSLTSSPLLGSARIGITTSSVPGEGSPVKFIKDDPNADLSKQIFSDNENYSVRYMGGLTVLTNKPTPKVTAAPEPNEGLIYTGEDQSIIKEGSGAVNMGKLLYALGENETAPPDDSAFKEEAPVGNSAGKYYVWYRIDERPEEGGVVIAEIAQRSIRNADITFEYELYYNKKEQVQKIKAVSVDGIFLDAEKDYDIDPSSVLKATDQGMYLVVINGKGNFFDSCEGRWFMGKPDLAPGYWESFVAEDAMNTLPDVVMEERTDHSIYLIKGQKFTTKSLIGWKMDKAYKRYLSMNNKGKVKAKKPVEEVVIKSGDGEKTIRINICDPELNKKKITLEAGEKTTVSFNGKNENLPQHFVTSDPDIFRVDDMGEVTAVSKGKALLTGYVNGKPFKCRVTVNESSPAMERSLHLNLGDKEKKLADNVLKKATWSASSNIVEISRGNVIKGVTAGTVSLNSPLPGGSGNYKAMVYVEDPTLKIPNIQSVGKDKYTLDMKVWTNVDIVFAEMYQDVTFISNKPEAAHDTGHGILRAQEAGRAVLKGKINGRKVTITVNVSG